MRVSKVRVILFFILFASLLFTVYKWWNSDQGKKYITQQRYDDSIQSDYLEEKEIKGNKKAYNVKFDELLQINNEIVGWLKIKDTPVNYPVVVHQDNTYYLNHNIDKEYSVSGSLFMDSSYYVEDRSNNNPFNYKEDSVLTVYGHNMGTWTDVMFTSFKSYLNESYYNKHTDVSVYVPKLQNEGEIGCQTYNYEILSVRVLSAYDSIYQLRSFEDSEEEQNWFDEQLLSSRYNCGNYRFTENGRYLILSTCANDEKENDRIVLVCRRKD